MLVVTFLRRASSSRSPQRAPWQDRKQGLLLLLQGRQRWVRLHRHSQRGAFFPPPPTARVCVAERKRRAHLPWTTRKSVDRPADVPEGVDARSIDRAFHSSTYTDPPPRMHSRHRTVTSLLPVDTSADDIVRLHRYIHTSTASTLDTTSFILVAHNNVQYSISTCMQYFCPIIRSY
jgi:hypothetical protein